jgi:hypothetical protein
MPLESPLWHLLDDDVLDRTWLVRNLLGGMSAGFGLRGASRRRIMAFEGRVFEIPRTFKQWCWIAIHFLPASSSCQDAWSKPSSSASYGSLLVRETA